MIFHVCDRAAWAQAVASRSYVGSRDDLRDGFIHFSTAAQLSESVAKHRAGQDNLVLVAVDPKSLGPELKWETSRGGQPFPHLYGALPLAAVCWWSDLKLGPDGTHIFSDLELSKADLGKLSCLYRLARPAVFMMDAERAHALALTALKSLPCSGLPQPDPILFTELWGRALMNPVGVSAGFDKNAEVPRQLFALGFGLVEVGSITPRPQSGNPKPRVFRLREDAGVINRLGFNNEGMEAAAGRLAAFRAKPFPGLLGVNIGKNKTSEDAAEDYRLAAQKLSAYADYLVINVSSPNTPGLRALQSGDDLKRLIAAVREVLAVGCPLLLKVAPDLQDADIQEISQVALEKGALDGLIVSNTTITRPDGLRSNRREETGGLSGQPLFELSTQMLSKFYRATEGQIPLVGVGGISTAEQAYAKIRAGASLVQLYSAMVYEGPGLGQTISKGLASLLRRDGFSSVSEAVGADDC